MIIYLWHLDFLARATRTLPGLALQQQHGQSSSREHRARSAASRLVGGFFFASSGCWAILKLADLEETALPHRSLIKRFCFCCPFSSVTRFERFPPRSLLTICLNCGNEYYFIHFLVPFFRKGLTTTSRTMLKSAIHVFVECKLKLWSIEYNQSVVIIKQQPRNIKGIVVLFRRTGHQQRQFSGWTVNWRLSTFSWEGWA